MLKKLTGVFFPNRVNDPCAKAVVWIGWSKTPGRLYDVMVLNNDGCRELNSSWRWPWEADQRRNQLCQR